MVGPGRKGKFVYALPAFSKERALINVLEKGSGSQVPRRLSRCTQCDPWRTFTFPHRYSAEALCPVCVWKASSGVHFISGPVYHALGPVQLYDFCQISLQVQQRGKALVFQALGLGKWFGMVKDVS